MKPETYDFAIDDQLVNEIASEADVCARSVTRRLAGLPVRGRAGARIDRALARRRADQEMPTAGPPEDAG